MQEGRKSNTVRNLLFAWISQGYTIVMNMAVRIVFVHTLSKDYVGVGGLFSNVISILSVAELGIGTAIVYGLYEPLANHDERRVKALMQFYQRVYICIGFFVGIVGIALTPYISWFIKDMPELPHLYTIYILFILNTALSYFFSYKASLISADQKDFVLKRIRIKVMMVMYLMQIVALLVFRDYIVFLCVQVVFTVIMNFCFSRAADRMYPFLLAKEKIPMDKEQLHQIARNTKALILHKIGGVIVFSTDNLIISKYTGLANVANYSNYLLIQNILNEVLIQVFSAMAASVGNMVAVEAREKNLQVYWRVMFLNAWLYGFCAICFLCLAQDFVRLCFGEDYLISLTLLICIVINFYIYGMRKSVMTFRDAYGLFVQNWYMPVFESGINLVASIWLIRRIGMLGVLLGTTVSSVAAPLWIEPCVLFKYGFREHMWKYWKRYLGYFILTVVTGCVCWWLCEKVPYIPVFSFVIRGGMCFVLINAIYFGIMRKSDSMQYYLCEIRRLKRKKAL